MRAAMCGLLARVATIVGSLTLLAFVLMSVTLDPGRPARVLNALLSSDAGKKVAAQVLASQVTRYDPNLSHDQAANLAQRVASDPRLPQALKVAERGDPDAALNAVLASVKRYDPTAAAAITKYLPHTTTGAPAVKLVPTSVGTTLFRIRHKLAAAVHDSLLIALVAAVGALAIGPRRDRVLRRLGRWCVVASVFQVVVWVGLPHLLDHLHGQWPVLVAVAVRAAGATVVPVVVTLMLSGAALLAAGYLSRLFRPLEPAPSGGVPAPAAWSQAPTQVRGQSIVPVPGRSRRSPTDVYRRNLDSHGPTRSWKA